jgi:mannose-6-phosphate isomerase-like protein (cupin superfamily)
MAEPMSSHIANVPRQIAKSAPARRASWGVKFAVDCDRFGVALQFSNWRFDCKVSAKDTEGGYCIYETARIGKGGPPMHVHYSQDEWFFVRRGKFVFKVGEGTFELEPGDCLLGPRKVPHGFASLSDSSSLLIAFIPAGTIEQLFSEIHAISRFRNPTLEDWRTISCSHDVEIVGPPLDCP